ncbi:serine phosphatase RsbU (regulator of sigma subunit) [Kitasatospora sp. MAA4]|uniref:PP2C family protein-serine/threonine phosphatase n=1 Tax=Kitasatospora sp. MAA4 TaxID=3035093 RepID=UPI00247438AD|nr:PP2C family protein-serine/threonine phosphatase [Kitasatospora sp. MAA4]MDH6135495.1 serine phosphatase RsbU (regulator of sigma subunit) [Kitasatospora sp. MAA4]
MARHRPSQPSSAHELLGRLGRLTAQALDHAELHRARVELAMALQRGLLPAGLPTVPGLWTAARYAPARNGLDIGGDWYDGFVLADGTLGFSIGDVQGHDVEAAAFMGQVRVGLRALATSAVDPGEVLGRANDLLLSLEGELFATCTFLRFDPATGELADARAGHVPALWATADGRHGIEDDVAGLPLGILPGEVYPVTRRVLSEPGAFVLVTDGVVEGPSFAIEEGLAQVLAVVRAGVGAEPGALAADVIKVAEQTGHKDDAAVLVLRHDGFHRED